MKYDNLLQCFSKQPFFETADLLTLFGETESQVLPRLSRWVGAGKLIRLRRGKYMLPTQYQSRSPHPFYISNYLYSPSYISLYTALEYFKLIPDHPPVIQAVTSRDTRRWHTPYGNYQYHSLKTDRFMGYQTFQVGDQSNQQTLIATPEKALVDICLLNGGEWDVKRWNSLRLQNTESLNPDVLSDYTRNIPSRKLARGVHALIRALKETK
ncbi:MAG: hypothetical protein HOC81_08995 [Candidatus Marinimicrobia bacterium]|nr:hypothetical protein [Candidatus Neomarinimicrobiota bacterium]